MSQDIKPVVCYLRRKWSLWFRWMLSFPLWAATESSFNESMKSFLVGALLLSLGGHTQSNYAPVPILKPCSHRPLKCAWDVLWPDCFCSTVKCVWTDEPVVFTNSSVLCICSSVFLFLLFLCLRDSEYSESLFLWQYFWSSWATRWMDIKH